MVPAYRYSFFDATSLSRFDLMVPAIFDIKSLTAIFTSGALKHISGASFGGTQSTHLLVLGVPFQSIHSTLSGFFQRSGLLAQNIPSSIWKPTAISYCLASSNDWLMSFVMSAFEKSSAMGPIITAGLRQAAEVAPVAERTA